MVSEDGYGPGHSGPLVGPGLFPGDNEEPLKVEFDIIRLNLFRRRYKMASR